MSLTPVNNQAWVTLATNPAYLTGALVLANSLRRVKTTRRLVIMTTNDLLQTVNKEKILEYFDEIVIVEEIDSGDIENLNLMNRPNLGVTFTKLHCWKLTQFEKCVFLDADTMVVQNCDELFNRDELSAAHDSGWPDCFNSGVFVYKPSLETYQNLITFANEHGSFDGGDQGLLNAYFSDWFSSNNRLSFIYNMVASAVYSYSPAYKEFGGNVKIVHFIGEMKPWDIHLDNQGTPMNIQAGSLTEQALDYIKKWCVMYYKDVATNVEQIHKYVKCHPFLYGDPQFMTNFAQKFSALVPGVMPQNPRFTGADISKASEVIKVDDEGPNRREDWESGQPDYTGAASFENIKKTLDKSMSKGQ